MTRAWTGESKSRDSEAAGRDAARRALEGLGGPPDACLVFGTAGHDQARLLSGVRSVVRAPIAGCSGAGVITRSGSDEGTHAVAVLALRSERARFSTLQEEGLARDAEGLGERLGARVATRAEARMLFVFPDGLAGSSTAFLRGLGRHVPETLPVFGGAAGELMRFERTFQYGDEGPRTDSVSALLVEGDLRFELDVTHGCRPLGLEHVVTRASGGTVFELDGRPAWEVLREYLDEPGDTFSSQDVPYLALAMRSAGDAQDVIRVPLGLDSATGALFFPGELPEGARLVMARRDADDVVTRAVDGAQALVRRAGPSPSFVVQADCTGRGRLLFGDQVTSRVIAPVQRAFEDDVPWIGFHSYGEIAPLGGAPRFHNYTMALCAAYDA